MLPEGTGFPDDSMIGNELHADRNLSFDLNVSDPGYEMAQVLIWLWFQYGFVCLTVL